MSHDSNPPAPDAQSPLTPAQRYIVSVARATVELHQGHGAEQMARWIASPLRTAVTDTVDLPGALVFAYELAIRQISELLAIIDTLTGAS